MSKQFRGRCKEQIQYDSVFDSRQCSRKAKKDGYCTQHHPETVAKRNAESCERWEEKRKKSPAYILKELVKEKHDVFVPLANAVRNYLPHAKTNIEQVRKAASKIEKLEEIIRASAAAGCAVSKTYLTGIQGTDVGHSCNLNGCDGTIQCGVDVRPVDGCSCHISPPCSACVDDPMVCDKCKREIEGVAE